MTSLPSAAEFAVRTLPGPRHPSPLPPPYTAAGARVAVETSPDALEQEFREGELHAFVKAGRRPDLRFSPADTRLGVVTCGGLCPGMNAVIRAVVREALGRYGVRSVLGFRFGYAGLVTRLGYEPIELTQADVDRIHLDGGSVLGTSRGHQDVTEMVDCLQHHGIDALIAIGGDGTLRGVHALCEEIQRRNLSIGVIGVPKTIDNDISFVQRSFGLETAVSIATQALLAAADEARSADGGIGLVRLMGRESGFIAAYASLASGVVNFCLIPEAPFPIAGPRGLVAAVAGRLRARGSAVIAVAEGAGRDLVGVLHKDASGNEKMGDIGVFLRDHLGQTLRAEGLHPDIKYIDPSYMVRGVAANPDDVVFCSSLGQEAVHAALAGYTDAVIGYWSDHLTYVPTSIATSKRQRVSLDSRLWQSVLHATGQNLYLEC